MLGFLITMVSKLLHQEHYYLVSYSEIKLNL